jgi:hypothetical protein
MPDTKALTEMNLMRRRSAGMMTAILNFNANNSGKINFFNLLLRFSEIKRKRIFKKKKLPKKV